MTEFYVYENIKGDPFICVQQKEGCKLLAKFDNSEEAKKYKEQITTKETDEQSNTRTH